MNYSVFNFELYLHNLKHPDAQVTEGNPDYIAPIEPQRYLNEDNCVKKLVNGEMVSTEMYRIQIEEGGKKVWALFKRLNTESING